MRGEKREEKPPPNREDWEEKWGDRWEKNGQNWEKKKRGAVEAFLEVKEGNICGEFLVNF